MASRYIARGIQIAELENFDQIQSSCHECEVVVKDDQRYCYNCGSYLGAQAVTINIFNNQSLRQIFAFYFFYLFICLLVKHTNYFNTYNQLFWIEIALAVITLRFAYLNRSEIKPILRFNNFKWGLFLGIVLLATVASFVISVTVREVNMAFFESEVNYYKAYKGYIFPGLLMVYSIAVMPAFFEELAFRGVMYNHSASFLDERLVVAVTAFLFAIMHLSIISMIWLIPFGFFIGHLRRKYNTLWYGIIFHFVFNLVACFIDLYRAGEFVSMFITMK